MPLNEGYQCLAEDNKNWVCLSLMGLRELEGASHELLAIVDKTVDINVPLTMN